MNAEHILTATDGDGPPFAWFAFLHTDAGYLSLWGIGEGAKSQIKDRASYTWQDQEAIGPFETREEAVSTLTFLMMGDPELYVLLVNDEDDAYLECRLCCRRALAGSVLCDEHAPRAPRCTCGALATTEHDQCRACAAQAPERTAGPCPRCLSTDTDADNIRLTCNACDLDLPWSTIEAAKYKGPYWEEGDAC
jgi:hypothetical protein